MSGIRRIINDAIREQLLTIPELVQDLLPVFPESEIRTCVQSMLTWHEIKLDEDMRLYPVEKESQVSAYPGAYDDLESALFCLNSLHPDFRVIGNVRAETLLKLLGSSIESKHVNGVFNDEGDWEPMISIPISEYEELREIKAMYEDLCK